MSKTKSPDLAAEIVEYMTQFMRELRFQGQFNSGTNIPMRAEAVLDRANEIEAVLAARRTAQAENERLRSDVRQLKAALPDCMDCGGSGHIDHAAKTTGPLSTQHSAAREICDRCDGLGVEL